MELRHDRDVEMVIQPMCDETCERMTALDCACVVVVVRWSMWRREVWHWLCGAVLA